MPFDVLAQSRIDPRLIALAAALEPFQQVGIKPEGR
jgi:hypothetical protein